MKKWITCLLATAISIPAVAFGQERQNSPSPSPADAPAAKATEVEALTVTSTQEQVRTTIDRTSYSFARDINAVTGTVSDVLRNIPSVAVDLQGNVSVRGDRNVTILIDGRPSADLTGATAAATLQMLPANRYERVEVSTNPSAADNPEGGAIINLVTRKRTGQGFTLQARENIGEEGAGASGLYATFNSNALALNLDIGERRRFGRRESSSVRETIDPLTSLAAHQ